MRAQGMFLVHYEAGKLWIDGVFKRKSPFNLRKLLDTEYAKWERNGKMRVLVLKNNDNYEIVGLADPETKAA